MKNLSSSYTHPSKNNAAIIAGRPSQQFCLYFTGNYFSYEGNWHLLQGVRNFKVPGMDPLLRRLLRIGKKLAFFSTLKTRADIQLIPGRKSGISFYD